MSEQCVNIFVLDLFNFMLNVKNFLDDTNLFSPNDYVKNDKIILQNFRQLKGWTNSIALFVVSIFFKENEKNLKTHRFYKKISSFYDFQ